MYIYTYVQHVQVPYIIKSHYIILHRILYIVYMCISTPTYIYTYIHTYTYIHIRLSPHPESEDPQVPVREGREGHHAITYYNIQHYTLI